MIYLMQNPGGHRKFWFQLVCIPCVYLQEPESEEADAIAFEA